MSKFKLKYSFIIPVKQINDYIRESVPAILQIKRRDYEIIIYPDSIDPHFHALKTTQIATGPVGPAAKRTLAIRDAKGEILIFIDDDAYPQIDFLDILDCAFTKYDTVAIGGPALTSSTDNFWQKVSGGVFLSSLAGGNPDRYLPLGQARPVDDWPSVNLSVKKTAFAAVKGFNSKYWPGEDTLFCLELIAKTRRPIIYEPQAIVYHHRRSGLIRHLKQISQYGLHRGFFAKKYPQTSLKFRYFLPSILLIYTVLWLLVIISHFSFPQSVILWSLLSIMTSGYAIYFLALIKVFFDIYQHEKNVWIGLNALYYVMFTHLIYGFNFIKGLFFTKTLKSHLRSQKLKN